MEEELIEIVNDRGDILGVVPRSEVHGNPSLMHRVVHVLVFNGKGQLLLQKRSMDKDVAPGRWDTSVGGHVDPGETLEDAAKRELLEELGVTGEPKFLYTYTHANEYETELVYTYYCVHEGPFEFNAEEIDAVRFWSVEEINAAMEGAVLSDNFKHEIATYLAGEPLSL
jgi:isopentenyl-diphosphate delta-isomerase type 1